MPGLVCELSGFVSFGAMDIYVVSGYTSPRGSGFQNRLPVYSGIPRGGRGGGHGPQAQALEGAPGQLVAASFKKKIRPRQKSKVTSLQCPGLT